MTNFFDRVYEVVQQIPIGKVTTYGQIARLLGEPKKSREVGWALHANKTMVVVPCHRVVNRYGHLSDAFVFGGISVQRQLLIQEGVEVTEKGVDLTLYMWTGERT